MDKIRQWMRDNEKCDNLELLTSGLVRIAVIRSEKGEKLTEAIRAHKRAESERRVIQDTTPYIAMLDGESATQADRRANHDQSEARTVELVKDGECKALRIEFDLLGDFITVLQQRIAYLRDEWKKQKLPEVVLNN